MVESYHIGEPELVIFSDPAAENPVYIYLSDDKKSFLFSKSIIDLLNDVRVEKPLAVSSEGLSFLLQSGVVPPPRSIYVNVFILGVGDSAKVNTTGGVIRVEFIRNFPFFRHQYDVDCKSEPDVNLLLEMLADATISKIDTARPSYMFHSAGKDSNSIALALAEAGWQDKVVLVTQKSRGDKDESEISKGIARRLGFKHKILQETNVFDWEVLEAIHKYFMVIPFPTTDQVTLAYPCYSLQGDFNNTNIVDGSGNDVYIGHIPSSSEFNKQKRLSKFHFGRIIADRMSSESKFRSLSQTRAEWCGLGGISFADMQRFFERTVNVYPHWLEVSNRGKDLDYIDFRASVRGVVIDAEKIIRKVRNFADYTGSNLVLPWTDENVSRYIFSLPEACLFDRKRLINKKFLRGMLKDKLGLDSDWLGKKNYAYDYYNLVENYRSDVESEILNCKYWDLYNVEALVGRLNRKSVKGLDSVRARDCLHKLYVVSLWLNRNKYVN